MYVGTWFVVSCEQIRSNKDCLDEWQWSRNGLVRRKYATGFLLIFVEISFNSVWGYAEWNGFDEVPTMSLYYETPFHLLAEWYIFVGGIKLVNLRVIRGVVMQASHNELAGIPLASRITLLRLHPKSRIWNSQCLKAEYQTPEGQNDGSLNTEGWKPGGWNAETKYRIRTYVYFSQKSGRFESIHVTM